MDASLAEVFLALPKGGIRTVGARSLLLVLELPAAAESEGVLLEGDRVGALEDMVDVGGPLRERVL